MFRAGEQGRFWYAVLGGSLEVRYHAPDTENKVWNILYFFVSVALYVRHTTECQRNQRRIRYLKKAECVLYNELSRRRAYKRAEERMKRPF